MNHFESDQCVNFINYNNIVLQYFDKNAPLPTVLRILGEFSLLIITFSANCVKNNQK